jgi:hypothetical protein
MQMVVMEIEPEEPTTNGREGTNGVDICDHHLDDGQPIKE